MRIFITGGCGFIGSHLVQYHLGKGDEVRVVDNLSTGTLENIAPFQDNPDFRFDKADILTWSGMKEAVVWADRIYHFAAVVGMFKVVSEPISVISSNIIGTNHLLNIIAEAKANPVVVIASSSSVYGDNPKKLLNENDNLIVKPLTHPLSTYAVSKLSEEVIGYAYHRSHAIPVILARMFNTIGPRQTGLYGMVVPRFVKQSCNNEPLTVFGDGTQTRSFCDVRDLVVALDLVANEPKSIGQSINIGNDYEISINDLAKLVGKCTGNNAKIQYVPYNEAYGMEYTDIAQRRPDITKLMQLIPFKHQWTLEKTINDLISRQRGLINK